MVFERWEGALRPMHAEPPSLQLLLPADEDAPAAARHALLAVLNGADAQAVADAELLVSEVVTNAVRYGAGGADIDVAYWHMNGRLEVVVVDGGPGFVPVERHRSSEERQGGLGLELLDLLADRWGCAAKGPGVVWFQMRIPVVAEVGDEDATELLDVRQLLDSVTDYALVGLDLEGNVTWWSRAAEALIGYPSEEILGHPLAELYAPASEREVAREMQNARLGRDARSEQWMRRKDGELIWATSAFAPIGTPRARGFSVVIADQTAHWRYEEERSSLLAELRELSLTDELTRLPNRRAWAQQLERELARGRRRHSGLVVAMLDLNGFKGYNDEHGHVKGDELLRTVAAVWSEPLRATDMLARYGGDEFVVTLPDCKPDEAFTVVTRMQAVTPRQISSAAGIASTDGFEESENLVMRADAALYEAKRQGTKAVFATAG